MAQQCQELRRQTQTPTRTTVLTAALLNSAAEMPRAITGEWTDKLYYISGLAYTRFVYGE